MQVTNSPTLQGAFGKSTIEIASWVAGDPAGGGACQGFVTGVTMTVTFSEATNKAKMPDQITRVQLDSLFSWRARLGQNYIGEWKNDKTLVITITNHFGATPPEIGYVIAQV